VRRRDAYSHYLESWEICDYEKPSLLSNLHVPGLCANLELVSLAINVLELVGSTSWRYQWHPGHVKEIDQKTVLARGQEVARKAMVDGKGPDVHHRSSAL